MSLLIAAFIAGELAVRAWEAFSQPTATLYGCVVPAGSRFKMKPDLTVRVPERYGTVVYRFNHAGYRDIDHATSSKRRRIVLLGDSVAFGLGASQEATYAAVLQRQLDSLLGTRYEVVNLAIFAYDSGHELTTLREEGLAYQPELVIIGFFMNDLSQPAPSAPQVPPSVWQRLKAGTNQYVYRSALIRRLHQGFTRVAYVLFHDIRRTRFPESLNDDEPRGKVGYLSAHPDDSTVPAFQSLLAIRDAAAARGARVLVMQTPDETQLFTRRYDAINARMKAFCEGQGLAYLDALPVLRAADHHETLFLDGVHLSARAHGLVGRRLSTILTEGGLLQPNPRTT